MAKRAVLSVCGKDFDLLEFNISLSQKINNMGKPASGVYLGDFYFIIPGGDDLFFEWLSDPTRMESGLVKVYYKTSSSPFVEYEFVQGFVTTIMENLYNNEGIGNAFNQVSMLEDDSEEFELWTNFFSHQFDGTKILSNTVAKTRQFQQRTGIEHVLMVTLSCEQVKIRNIVLDNRWTTERK